MSLYKRPDSAFWWVRVTVGKKTVRRSAETADRQEAERLEARLREELWQTQKLGTKPAYTWEDAVVRWLSESQDNRSIHTDKERLVWLDPHLSGFLLRDINRDKVDAVMTVKSAEGVKPATLNRYVGMISRIMNKAAKEWGWLDTLPVFRRYKEPKGVVRWITSDEAARLIRSAPKGLQPMIEFSLMTGIRQDNCFNLQWSWIDMQTKRCWIPAGEFKQGRDFGFPLNDRAIEILKDQIGNHSTHVFISSKGDPYKVLGTDSWRRACKKAGITNFRWHDLRHTWASWHVQTGTDLRTLMELGGWSTFEMVLRYAHLNPDNLRNDANRITNSSRSNVIPFPEQGVKGA